MTKLTKDGRPKQSGGVRPGGGRPKGSVSKRFAVSRGAVEYLQSVYMDEDNPQNVRLDAAKAAAPYERAKYAPITEGDKSSSTEYLETIEKLHKQALEHGKPDGATNGKAQEAH